MITELDCAYAAGLLDGEGCVRVDDHHGFCVQITVAMVDKAPLEWLHEVFGGHLYFMDPPSSLKSNRQPKWVWRITTKAARTFLRMVRPWLKVKNKHADLILELLFFPQGDWRKMSPEIRNQRKLTLERLRILNAKGREKRGR